MSRPRPLLSRLGGLATVLAVKALFGLARLLGPARSSDLGAFVGRRLGPLLPQHRIALRNLRAAFPDLDEPALAAIALGAWANLGRTGAEYAHLGNLVDLAPDGTPGRRVEILGLDHLRALRDDGKPGLLFSAHLGNWELPAIVGARLGLDATAVFRPPNEQAVAALIHQIRSGTMGGLAASAGQGAAFAIAAVLERGGHLGQLIDQHFTRGVPVVFMGRPALGNPLIAKLARHFDCPVHGVRVVRLPGHRFRVELTPPLDLPRTASGDVDVPASTQLMTSVVEGWVREHPEQWLWMHRRWRPARAV